MGNELTSSMPQISLNNQILITMLLGEILGWFLQTYGVALKPIDDAFLRMIKMIVVPLAFAGMITGIAGSDDFKKMGRLGLKSMVWFELATHSGAVLSLMKEGEHLAQ